MTANPWAGERALAGIPGHEETVLRADIGTVARVMAALGTDTLDGMADKLRARNPDTLQKALVEFSGVDAPSVMAALPGAQGLTILFGAIFGALSGLTPEEEEAEKKAQAAVEQDARLMAMRMFAAALNSANGPSATG